MTFFNNSFLQSYLTNSLTKYYKIYLKGYINYELQIFSLVKLYTFINTIIKAQYTAGNNCQSFYSWSIDLFKSNLNWSYL